MVPDQVPDTLVEGAVFDPPQLVTAIAANTTEPSLKIRDVRWPQ
jgi:hypothetical protein